MRSMIFVVFNVSEMYFGNSRALRFCYYTRLFTVDDLIPSHIGKDKGGMVKVEQEHEEVKWYCFLRNYLLFTLYVIFNVHHCVIFPCPQLINDVDYKLSGDNGFGNADGREEGTSYFSNYSNIEGSTALDSRSLLCCVH